MKIKVKTRSRVQGILMLFFLLAAQGFCPLQAGEKITVTGSVQDESGEDLIGVTIRLKDTSTGTATDMNGKYVLDVPASAVLIFSYIGYKEQEIPINGNRVVNVILQQNDQALQEVTVVGYGVQKKISVIGTQQTIRAEEVKIPVRNLTNSLAGRVAGLVSVQRSGEPGFDDSQIYIRGISTLSAGMSAPLTLVDGVPRSFSDIDPEDIESFSILKDASATAVYGVRGANGVIIITTKSGKIGKPKFNIRYTEGITRFTRLPEFADGPTYMSMSNEALLTRGAGQGQYSGDEIEMTKSGADPYLYPNVDWFDVLFDDFSHNRTANANISGGSENARYYIGLGYYDELGLYKTDVLNDYNANAYYKRYTVTSNTTLKPTRTTGIKLGIQGHLAHANYPATGVGTIFSNAFFVTPNYIVPEYPDGKVGDRLSGGVNNPYALLNYTGYANQWRNQLFSNLRITQDLPFVKGLSVTGMFSFDVYNYTSNRFTKTPDTWQATGRDGDGNLIYSQTNVGTEFLAYSNNSTGSRTLYREAAINYKNKFGLHDVSAMLLFNQSDEIDTKASNLEDALPYRFRGLAGRSTYAYNDRYFAEFNFGYNGSENFLPDKRFGFFPSAGFGWVISNEPFFGSLSSAIQLLKLRATYGRVGNSQLNSDRRFLYLATVSSPTGYTYGRNMDQGYSGKDIGEYAVDVSWETADKSNIGVDLMALDSKLNIQLNVFREERKGIFLRRGSLPAYVGMINAPYGNIGKVNNKGFDGSVNYNNKWDKWSLSLLGNFSFNRNKVIDDDRPWPNPWQYRIGQKVGQRFGYIALGLFESDEEVARSPVQAGDTRAGDIRYKDINGDGVIDDYDQVPIGWGSVPEIIYGFGFTVGYKNISLSTLFQGAAHTDIMMNGEGLTPFSQGLSRGNLLSNIEDRWTEDNPRQDVFYPRLMAGTLNMNYETSTWWLKNANYLRLKNIQLAYSIPQSWLPKIHIDAASIFFQGVNVLTFSSFKMWDVEMGDGKGASYPNVASYSLGVNFSF